ncbi:MAG: H-X9-DG-CTERM domain-containing protein [Armatimonadia bacterium]
MWSIVHRILLWLLMLSLLVVISVVGVRYVAQSREKPRSTSCHSNVKQLVWASLAYAQDYEGRLPNALTWSSDLLPYYKNERMLHCPQDLRKAERGYDMLQRRGLQRLPSDDAGTLILLYEIGKHGVEYRHNDGMNIGFCDGHVKWYSPRVMTPEVILRGVVEETKP